LAIPRSNTMTKISRYAAVRRAPGVLDGLTRAVNHDP